MKFNEFLSKIKENILDALYPNNIKCIFCHRDIPNFDELPCCDDCAKSGIFNDGKRCNICDMQIRDDSVICDFCKNKKKNFEKAFCPLLYNDIVRRVILKLKNDNGRYLAYPFARLIYNRIKESNVSIDLIIPVPIHDKTRKRRGYNQAQLIAIELGKLLNAEVCDEVITKDKLTESQKNLPYHDRIKNIENCFSLRDKAKIKNKSVLIVDDVMTTGATMNEIARIIKPYTSHIYVCAVARDNLKY